MFRIRTIALTAALLLAGSARAQEGLLGKIDLATTKGVEAVKGEWRYADVTTGVGPAKDGIEPKAHGAFDDAKWEVLKPETLKQGRGAGGYCWCWYRIKLTIPDTVDGKKFEGGPVWFSTVVDDYGEVWVDGALNHKVGETGRGEVSGFNAINRVRLQKPGEGKTKRDAKPGDVFQIAVLGINGPLGNPPGNKIFLHGFTGLGFFAADAPGGGANKPALVAEPKGAKVTQVSLLSKEGTEAVKGEWRRHRVEVHTGPKKNEIAPKAHGKFDDSKWEALPDPAALKKWDKDFEKGKFSMAWYRIQVTIPEKVNGKDVAGTAVYFRTTVDDYGEVWVNGKLDQAYGKSGGGAISGFNYPNLVKLTDQAKPGETIQLAVLAINSPFGVPPNNGIFFRNGDLLFYAPADTKK